MTEVHGTPQPQAGGEITPQITPPVPASDEEKEQLNKKLIELEAQKEHWRTKYERDISNVPSQVIPDSSDEVFSDEGKTIVEKYLAPLESKISSLEDQLALKDLQTTYPDLKGLSNEFNEYRKDYPKHKLENVAKIFLQEKGLLETPIRKGLEKPTGGPRTPISSGMTVDEIKSLRETNFRLYQDMLMKGQIKVG